MSDSQTTGCSGPCSRCDVEHTLSAGPAMNAAHRLMATLERTKRIDLTVPEAQAEPRFSTDYLWGEARGQMFGVMTYVDATGREGELRAFSGQYNGEWEVDGWVGPLLDVRAFEQLTFERERAIKAIGRSIAAETDDEQRLALTRQRRDMSRTLMAEIFELFELPDFRGNVRKLPQVFQGKGIPTGTGDCCAPKLLGHAAKNGLTPTGIAEFFWGRSNRSGTREHGHFYPACAEKCRPILGHMLCGLTE